MLTAALALLLTSACASTTSGSGSSATSTAGGRSSSTPSTAATTQSGLVPYKGDRFSVSMPGTPVKSSQRVSTPAGPVKLISLTVEKSDKAFIVGYTDYPTGTSIDLNGAAQGAAKNVNGRLADLQQVTYRGMPALDFRVVKAQGRATLFQRVLAVNNRLYQLLVAVPGPDVKTPPPVYPLMRDSLTF
jgi:hypothetical protein